MRSALRSKCCRLAFDRVVLAPASAVGGVSKGRWYASRPPVRDHDANWSFFDGALQFNHPRQFITHCPNLDNVVTFDTLLQVASKSDERRIGTPPGLFAGHVAPKLLRLIAIRDVALFTAQNMSAAMIWNGVILWRAYADLLGNFQRRTANRQTIRYCLPVYDFPLQVDFRSCINYL